MLTHVNSLSSVDLKPMLEESRAQGFRMIRRMVNEWESGTMDFSAANAAMFAWVAQGTLLGIGGICEEPYLHIPRYGRVRHVYVMLSARRRGIGSALVRGILCFARQHYDLVTLRTPGDGSADHFYERLGFVKHDALETVTHVRTWALGVGPRLRR